MILFVHKMYILHEFLCKSVRVIQYTYNWRHAACLLRKQGKYDVFTVVALPSTM